MRPAFESGERNQARRVLVIGCPGAGKSCFSVRLAEITGLPLIHLDSLYHRDTWSADPACKKTQWREKVAELVGGERWIIDGNYKGSFDIRMPAADTIVFMDYPRRLCLARAFRRRWQYRRAKRPDMPNNWREKISWEFLRFIWTYRATERPRVMALLDQQDLGKTIVVLTSPKEAERYLEAHRYETP
jgi:adenylate kinase family enzyme